jgi:hypothetical protein
MKPLLVADSILGQIGKKLPILDITGCGAIITSARETRYDPARVRAPFPVMVVAASIEPLARSLSMELFPPKLEKLGRMVEMGFVVFNKKTLTGSPYVVRQDGSFGKIECEATVDDNGDVVPGRSLVNTYFEPLIGRWFRSVVDCLRMLELGSFSLISAPVEVDESGYRERLRDGLPVDYLQLQARL